MKRRYFFLILSVLVMNTGISRAYEYSQEYINCEKSRGYANQLSCLQEEKIRLWQRIDELQKKVESSSLYNGLKVTGYTLEQQKKNWNDYINSFCTYSAATECDDYRNPEVNKEDCLIKFSSVLLEAWQDILPEEPNRY